MPEIENLPDTAEKDCGYTVELSADVNDGDDLKELSTEKNFDLEGAEDEAFEEPEVKSKPLKKKHKELIIAAAVLTAVCFAVSYCLYLSKAVPKRCDENYSYVMSEFGIISDGLPNGANPSLGAIYKINSELAGVITIDGTKINYPFVKPEIHSEEYYQSHLFNFVRCNYGTIYTSSGFSKSGYCENTVLYGKNTSDGRMFSDLSDYTDIRNYKKNPIVTVNGMYSEVKYKIFAVCITDKPFDIPDRFITEEEAKAFSDAALTYSLYYTNLSGSGGDKFLTLVTDYEYGGKLIIVARSIRSGEALNVNDDYIEYKSVGKPYVPEDGSSEIAEVIEQPDITVNTEAVAQVTDEEGKPAENEQNAGAILPSVEEEPQPEAPKNEPDSSSSQTSSAQSKPEGGDASLPLEYIVTTQSTPLNIRSTPEQSGKRLGSVNKGETVTVTEINNGWGYITVNNISGWVNMKYLTLKESDASQPQQSAPEVPAPPAPTEGTATASPEGYTYYNANAANEIITVVSSKGNTYSESAYSILCRIVEMEVGSGYPTETIKAQAVASYSYLMNRIRAGRTPTGISMKSYESVGTRVKQCVASVIGQTLTYNGSVCDAYYSTCTAGVTNDVTDVWNSGSQIPYLTVVDSSIDRNYSGFTSKKVISAAEAAERMKKYINTDVSGVADKTSWIVILGKNKSGVYNGAVSVAGKTSYISTSTGNTVAITGQRIYSIMNLRSAAFDVEYDAGSDSFIFTTYGWGHGVGMSQVGAYYYAVLENWDYRQILYHYYPGSVIREYA